MAKYLKGYGDYDATKAKVVGNYNKIVDRYPRDFIMHDYLRKTTNGIIQLIISVIEDKEELQRLKNDLGEFYGN